MELHKRKTNRWPSYNYSSNGSYFITICTYDKEKILGKIIPAGNYDIPKVVLSDYGKIVEKFVLSINDVNNLNVDNYVIMPNHIHLLLSIDTSDNYDGSPPNATIPHVISTFKRFCNAEIGKNIFQRSYYDHVIRDETDYLRIWNYIETNPHKWELDKYYS